jgi:hypothetical protein
MANHGWRDKAACIGLPSELFFPTSMSIHKWDEGKAVCAGCPVKEECLQVALAHDELEDRWGIFGGLSPSERLQLRDKKNQIIFRK